MAFNKFNEFKDDLIYLDKKLGLKTGRPEGFITRGIELSRLYTAQAKSNTEQNEKIINKIKEGYSPELSVNNIDKIKSKVDELFDENETNEKEMNGEIIFESLAIDDINEVMNIISEKTELEEIIKSYYGSDIKIKGLSAIKYKNRPSEIELSSEDRTVRDWHVDYIGNSTLVRVLLPLTEYQEERPLEIVSREQTKKLIKEHSHEEIRNNPEIAEKRPEISELEGKKGQPLIFTPTVNFHRGANPKKSEEREVLLISFIPDN